MPFSVKISFFYLIPLSRFIYSKSNLRELLYQRIKNQKTSFRETILGRNILVLISDFLGCYVKKSIVRQVTKTNVF